MSGYFASGEEGNVLANTSNLILPRRGLAVRMRTGKQLSTNLWETPDYDKELPGTGKKLTPIYIQKPLLP